MRIGAKSETWLRQHPKVLSVAGSLVVLLTFTIREAWRDSVKEEISGAEASLSAFQLENEILNTQNTLNDPTRTGPPQSAKEFAVALLNHQQKLLIDLSRTSASEEMVKRFPSTEAKEALSSANSASPPVSALLEESQKDYQNVVKSSLSSDQSPVLQADRSDQAVSHQQAILEAHLAKAGSLVQENAHKYIDAKKKELHWLTVIGIGFYMVGGFIGIVGTLADVRMNKGEE
jgi:hypothetical protein